MEDIIKNDKNLDAVKDDINPNADKTKDDSTKETKQEVKTFTQAEVDKMIEKRLAREKQKQEAEIAEAKKLEQMNAEEKMKYEYEKKQKELDERLAEINKKELQQTSLIILQEDKKYSASTSKALLDFIDYTDAESAKASIDKLDKVLKECIETEVSAKIKSGGNISPKKPEGNPPNPQLSAFKKAIGLK